MSRVLLKSAWGSDDPTKAAFPFLHANAFAEAGHEVQIFLLGEAVGLMRSCVANAVVPVGWPPLAETLTKTIELGTNIHVGTACSRARGVLEADLANKHASFATPATLIALVEWADKILCEGRGDMARCPLATILSKQVEGMPFHFTDEFRKSIFQQADTFYDEWKRKPNTTSQNLRFTYYGSMPFTIPRQ